MGSIDRAQIELDNNRAWRAKEILGGTIRNRPFDVALYEKYGQVLQELGDLCEAGKYLFLSGQDQDLESVEIYLKRYRSMDSLMASFPRAARNLPVEEYPQLVREVLRSRGYDKPKSKTPCWSRTTLPSVVTVPLCLILFILLVACTVVGAGQLLTWFSSWIFE